MKLPAFPKVSTKILLAIAERHDVDSRTFSRLPEVGIFNAIYTLGSDIILRIPRNHPAFTAAARKEALAGPAARAAGVRTPALVAFDDTLDLLPVPYTLYERIHGATLGLLDCEPGATPGVWREIGRDLALLHTRVVDAGALAEITGDMLPDPRHLLAEIAQEGYFTAMEARWLMGWLDRLAPAALAPIPRRFLHGDLQTTNVMVRADSLEYLALLDWGSAGWGDPAWDFAGVPLRAAPWLLAGYRDVAPLDNDATAEARILWRHLHLALFNLRRGPLPQRSWAERPMTMLLEIMRFLIEAPGESWRSFVE
jgi:aminoglycoside phosphotransferase (APT) family kinase protein